MRPCKNPLCDNKVEEKSNRRPLEYCSEECRIFCRKEKKQGYRRKDERQRRRELREALAARKLRDKQTLERRAALMAEAVEAAKEYKHRKGKLLIKKSRMEFRDEVNL